MYNIIGVDQKEYGPVSPDQIRQWAAQGRVTGRTLARPQGAGGWQPLSTIPEFAFLGASAQPPVIPNAARPGMAAGGTTLPADILERDYDLDIGSCLSRALKLYTNNFGLMLGGTAVFLVCQWAMVILGIIPFIGALLLMAGLLSVFILVAGFDCFVLKIIRGQGAEVADIFSVFQTRLAQLLLVALVMFGVSMAAAVPGAIIMVIGFFVLFAGNMQAFLGGHPVLSLGPGLAVLFTGFIVEYFPMLVVSTFWMFSLPLIVDKRMDFWPAMETSRKVVCRHWFKAFVLFIFCFVINVAGAWMCCVGALFTFPIGVGALMYAYEDLFSERKPAMPAPPSIP